ncbi:hypothetical protein MUG78_11635 [Gordonia alkaliphila]|uniref:hypothetical protein n=1 Tax=Gordonia alkaliphila TaxID=1053547 RepID=UPI001FF674EC|nr:hypothetical protein [Gordonia alkaliphila]MCK0440090.1 hypothetical protein [Gordonia alkaliphila]
MDRAAAAQQGPRVGLGGHLGGAARAQTQVFLGAAAGGTAQHAVDVGDDRVGGEVIGGAEGATGAILRIRGEGRTRRRPAPCPGGSVVCHGRHLFHTSRTPTTVAAEMHPA